jgi:hypothetical protein
MRKQRKKLSLSRETIHHLAYVSGAVSGDTVCGYTCLRECRPVPTVDACPSQIACTNDPNTGCCSGIGC